MELLILLPVATGLLLWWVIRNDNRRRFVQQRLAALTKRDIGEAAPSLHRKAQTAFYVPKNMRQRYDAVFEAAGNRIGALHLAIISLLATVVVVAVTSRIMGYSIGLVIIFGLIAATGAPVAALRFAQARYRARFLDAFPDALDLIRRGIRSGLPVNEALVVAAREIPDPVGAELRRTLDQVQIGVPMNDALQETANRIRVADFRFLVVALVLQQKTGGSLAETLANLSAVIRARKALRLKARSLTAEAKVSAMVLAALPFMVGGAMYVLNHNLVQPLLFDPRGRFMLGVAFFSLVTGLTTMHVMVRRAVR
jgi:tight adherence protein B